MAKKKTKQAIPPENSQVTGKYRTSDDQVYLVFSEGRNLKAVRLSVDTHRDNPAFPISPDAVLRNVQFTSWVKIN